MLLNPSILTEGLMRLSASPAPSSPIEAANRWFDAWWGYARDMSHLNPAVVLLPTTDTALRTIFLPPLVPSLAVPNPTPLVFFNALEVAMRAAWSPLGLGTPVYLLPAYASITPTPLVFSVLGLPVIPIGIAATAPAPPMQYLAGAIHTWTLGHLSVTPSGASVPFV